MCARRWDTVHTQIPRKYGPLTMSVQQAPSCKGLGQTDIKHREMKSRVTLIAQAATLQLNPVFKRKERPSMRMADRPLAMIHA